MTTRLRTFSAVSVAAVLVAAMTAAARWMQARPRPTTEEETRRLHRYEFLFTAAPLRIEQGMGSPINPIATF